jgi:hypothetical protein
MPVNPGFTLKFRLMLIQAKFANSSGYSFPLQKAIPFSGSKTQQPMYLITCAIDPGPFFLMSC